ncbi:MAG: trypsin-like peptidase domain-containing protein [Alphaproteobacteria bacterium]|nr:trypsin-like peptidase domain-containing protein [Alphaproteobacteria bacterium]
MPEHGIRSPYSQCPLQILMNDNQGVISTGTGFFYSYNDKNYLITNWHNISGKNFLTKEPNSAIRRFPTFLEVKLSAWLPGKNDTFTTISQRLEIYQNGEPIWLEHRELGNDCDVVAIEFSKPQNCPTFMHTAANKICSIKTPIKPGNPVFVLGFPRSISVAFGIPLWKSGYIASEPFYDVTIGGNQNAIGGMTDGKKLPAFFIDSQTREGMSGAPVFSAFTGTWSMTDPYEQLNIDDPTFWKRHDVALFETRMEFIGCYSARIGKEEEGAALGLCWRKDEIESICSAGKIGKHPHIS